MYHSLRHAGQRRHEKKRRDSGGSAVRGLTGAASISNQQPLCAPSFCLSCLGLPCFHPLQNLEDTSENALITVEGTLKLEATSPVPTPVEEDESVI